MAFNNNITHFNPTWAAYGLLPPLGTFSTFFFYLRIFGLFHGILMIIFFYRHENWTWFTHRIRLINCRNDALTARNLTFCFLLPFDSFYFCTQIMSFYFAVACNEWCLGLHKWMGKTGLQTQQMLDLSIFVWYSIVIFRFAKFVFFLVLLKLKKKYLSNRSRFVWKWTQIGLILTTTTVETKPISK